LLEIYLFILDITCLCTALAGKHNCGSLSKLQVCQQEVKYLGLILKEGQRLADPERVQAIVEIPGLVTKKQLQGFLGAVGYCRAWIPGPGELSKPWTEATKAEELVCIRWGPEREKAFQAMEGALAPAPSLGLPDYSKSFELFVH